MSGVSRYRRIVAQPEPLLTSPHDVPSAKVTTGATVDRLTVKNRLKPRTAELMAAVERLDTTVDTAAHAEVIAWIRDEYDARQGGMLIGLFSTCNLGHPYVDHKLSLAQTILEHYSQADDPGYPYNKARGLVRSRAYAFIEIYSDGAIVPIRPDGTSVEFTPTT